ncbi:hypothetical protein D3C76_1243660 [compost metagenome]
MLFAVANTKTGAVFSCIQVNNVPNTREAVPPSDAPPEEPESPFSISSIHRMQGEIASAVRSAERILDSEEPTTPWKIFPMSKRNNDMFHDDDTHFAVRDLPQPGTPVKSNPFGVPTPNS